ncbi:MAG TPA: cytochrome c [Terriglobales bacterium]|nr:cytochrome c [Terriglobales bacterium]
MAKRGFPGWAWGLIVIGIIIGGGVTWVRTARGFSAAAKPTALETWLATLARNWALPAGEKQLRNPLPPTAANLTAGREHFAAHCAICHDNNGDGLTDMGKNFYPKPPDLRGFTTQGKSDGALFYTIRNGIRMSGMPAWPDDDADDIWRLVLFIRHLPKQTPDELRQMQAYNPRSIYPEPVM